MGEGAVSEGEEGGPAVNVFSFVSFRGRRNRLSFSWLSFVFFLCRVLPFLCFGGEARRGVGDWVARSLTLRSWGQDRL